MLPEIVADREDGFKAVKYDKIVALLIESVKELDVEIRNINEKIIKINEQLFKEGN